MKLSCGCCELTWSWRLSNSNWPWMMKISYAFHVNILCGGIKCYWNPFLYLLNWKSWIILGCFVQPAKGKINYLLVISPPKQTHVFTSELFWLLEITDEVMLTYHSWKVVELWQLHVYTSAYATKNHKTEGNSNNDNMWMVIVEYRKK